jgi:hypothetical protein
MAAITVNLPDSNVVGAIVPSVLRFPLGAKVAVDLVLQRGGVVDPLSGSMSLVPSISLGRVGIPFVTATSFSAVAGKWTCTMSLDTQALVDWVSTAKEADVLCEVSINDAQGFRVAEAIGKATISNVIGQVATVILSSWATVSGETWADNYGESWASI